MNPAQGINRLMLLALAPFLGGMLFLTLTALPIDLPERTLPAAAEPGLREGMETTLSLLDRSRTDAALTRTTVQNYYELYAQSTAVASSMVKTAAAAAKRPAAVFDSRFGAKLGTGPSRAAASPNVDLKLYTFQESQYTGYALKVSLPSDQGMRMVLGKDEVGGSETTLEAVKRYGAVAGVNAGGFADDAKTGKRYPLSTTMVGGKYVYGFEPTFEDLAFIGLNKDRKLIGGKFSRQEDLDKLQPEFGATFVPVLLRGGVKQPIPSQWLTSPARAPRTIVGSFKNDQLLFLVTDGYDENGNSGATLPELQDKLLALGIQDAYNLDGGGSSTLIFDGQVINHPSDGRLRPLSTHFLFFQ
ncbi:MULTISPECIES: phosphodiester glycosidase family protein [Paenibacillus]|uniref:phosphodiester glycosidase family protein n=1 Tax=Paenibacillus TaxID=44249 RepID=UPI0022B8DB58|nr:phosphodiester glycosidase family protein [Paenibacillus caseinilyticus]MCZ8519291.1 phosphodiester glycosidase family protein [Paenibacillus caseinilyticus]